MAGKKFMFPLLFLIITSQVECATLMETSYEYVMSFGKSIGPGLMSLWDCIGEEEAWTCAREKAGKILDGWGEKVDNERRNWKEAADAEVTSSGRSFGELPSKIGEDVEVSIASLAEIFHNSFARALESRKHDSGGIDSITISTGGDKKMKKKKKQKPPKIHLLHPIMMPTRKAQKAEKGRSFPIGRQSWVIGETVEHESVAIDGVERGVDGVVVEKGVEVDGRGYADKLGSDVGGTREARGLWADLKGMGSEAMDMLADTAMEAENKDNGVQDKSSFEGDGPEQRGKKKKKKKAILKLLILGAVLKAKIGTLLQILSFKLQVKFFIVAVLGLAINLARLWIDLKNKHQQQPQKVIYYEHAQHQHHYDHEDEHESQGWGPWSRSMEPEETDADVDVDIQNSPYRAQIRNPHLYSRPVNA